MRFLQTFGRVVPLIGLIVLPAVSAQAGLFDFFSSAPPEPQTMTIEQSTPSTLPPLVSPLPPHRVEIHRHITVVHKNSSDKTPVFDHQSFGLKKDATLREGDAVMTRSGIRIFAGTSSGEHQTDEFAKLEEAKGLSPAEQTALAAIDAPYGEIKSASADELMTGRSTVANSSVAWKWLRDPKGRLVRYVGP